MPINWEVVGWGGFRFFGRMSASMTHEIKNVLAIINERAGLLNDLTMMAEKGLPLDGQRLSAISVKIMEQVRRADGIMKNMNVFAHSVDEPTRTVNLDEVIAMVVTLSARFAVNRGITLGQSPSAHPLSITTSPFLLANLIWLCLDRAMDMVGADKTITIAGQGVENGVRIRFEHGGKWEGGEASLFTEEGETQLFQLLGARKEDELPAGVLTLFLPTSLCVSIPMDGNR